MKKRIYVVTSWDDITKLDLKLADLLENYGIKGTFFVITGEVGSKISLDDLGYLSEAHEVGAHTITHPHLPKLSLDAARKEVLDSGQFLSEKLDLPLDRMPFAYPYGEYSREHIILVKSAGYCCARTTEPFHINYPSNLYEMGVSVWAYPHAFQNLRGFLRVAKILPRILGNPMDLKKWDTLAKKLFDVVRLRGGTFHLFGHTHQIEEKDLWDRLRDVLNYLAYYKEVVYVTLSDYCSRAGLHE